jgi:hypothetical protein
MKEVQIYTRVKQVWIGNRLEIEAMYLPSVYTAKATVQVHELMPEEERQALAHSVLDILEDRLKTDFKRQLESTEETDGFLEPKSLVKLSNRFSQYMLRALGKASCKWDIAID